MSTPIYLQQGIAFIDQFTYQLSTGGFVTGKTQGSFTIVLSNATTTVVSPSGVTITEVGLGVYQITIAASAFLATNGSYELLIYDTATPIYSWEQVYEVTPSGLPGPIATVSFTSTAGNGRVTDGTGNPLSGARVLITLGTVYQTALTTNALGNWGPVFLPAGTYTVYAQLAGYSQASGSLVFTSSTATGPGADLAMTAIANVSTIVASDMWTYARQQSYDQVGSSADLKIKRAVNSATDMIAQERKFNWWLRRQNLTINGFQNVTVLLTNGSANIVIQSGTFPAWATVGAKIKVNSGASNSQAILDLTSQTNNTTVTFNGTWAGPTAATYAGVLFQDTYALPTNMYQFGRILPGQQWGWGGLPVSAETIWEWQNASAFQQQGPSGFAIANGSVIIWPFPSVTQNYNYTMHARPVPAQNPSDTIDWDPAQITLLKFAINYQIAVEFGKAVAGGIDECLKAYRDALGRMVTTDKLPSDLPSVSNYSGLYGQPGLWSKNPRAP